MSRENKGRFLSVREAAQQLGIDVSAGLSIKNDVFKGAYRGRISLRDELIHFRPNQTHPVLLLPVRLETRFRGSQLLVRIYPDQIFVNAHEQRLTQDELEAGLDFQSNFDAGSDEEKKSAWRELARRFGPERAAWIAKKVRESDDPGQIPIKDEEAEGWLTVPWLAGLPTQFVVYAYRGDQLVHGPVFGNRITGSFRLLPSAPAEGELLDYHSKWLADFEAAETRGMAVRLDSQDLREGISKLIVVGLKEVHPWRGQEWLAHMLDSHHYATGFGFLDYGTQTNNTRTTRSGYSETKEDREGSYNQSELEGYEPSGEPPKEPRTNAECLEWALGLFETDQEQESEEPIITRSEVLRYISGADKMFDPCAADMRTALWPATGDYLLRYLLPGLVDDDGNHLKRFAEHFIDFVRASGPLPTIRVGDQPYGILPVTSVRPKTANHPHGWEASSRDNADNDSAEVFDGNLHRILTNLHEQWLTWAMNHERVPRVNTMNDPDQELLQILAMEPTSISHHTRPFVPESVVGWLVVALRDEVFGAETPYAGEHDPKFWVREWAEIWWHTRERQAQHWSELTNAPAEQFKDAPLMRLLSWWNVKPLEQPLVRGKEDGQDPAQYLDQILDQIEDATAMTLLHDLLQRSLYLVKHAAAPVTEEELTDAIGQLVNVAGAEGLLERLLSQSLDLCTHRLDAWITSLATKRLESMRNQNPYGVYLGAYGSVEDLKPRDGNEKEESEGYIHAPSTGQAAAAAVLHNAYLTHTDGAKPNPFRINLNSERVRRGLFICEGVRQGQPLGALLGYQFERALHEQQLDRYIDDFRRARPIVANKETEPNPNDDIEAMAARNVVDGLALARWWQEIAEMAEEDRDKEIEAIIGAQPPLSDDERHALTALAAELHNLLANLDAVGDLLLSEGVYQAVQGNFERAGAALEAAAGNAAPPEIESVVTPVRGKTLGHRVCILFPPETVASQGPRATAEPRLAAWFSRTFSDLSQIGCSYTFKSRRFNINDDPMDELALLPGISDLTAQWIVDCRQQHGSFNMVDELETSCGIDRTVVEAIRPWVMTGREAEEQEKYYQRINVNTASADELEKLPGIGSTKAEAIIEHRPYTRTADLENITGIGAATVEEIRPFVTTGVTIEELGLSAIDLLYLSTAPPMGDETDIERRIAYFVRQKYGLSYDTRVDIDFSRSGGFAYSIGEAIELGRQILDTLGMGSFLQPGSLCLPAEAEEASFTLDDVNELESRISTALRHLCELILRLGGEPITDLDGNTICSGVPPAANDDEIIDCLFEASQFGMSEAIPPGSDDQDLDTRRQNVLAELQKRSDECQKLRQEAAPDTVDPNRKITLLIDAMKALFGRGFIVLPEFVPHQVDALFESYTSGDLLSGFGEERVRLWLQQVAPVHPALRAFDDVMMMTEAWRHPNDRAAEPTLNLLVAQLPRVEDTMWLALDDDERGGSFNADETSDRSALSVVIASAGSPDWLRPQSVDDLPPLVGVLIDQWDELIPSNTVDTSLAFHYDGPNTQAPQSLLLAVPSQRDETPKRWEPDELAEIIKDTIDLAKTRAVDLDAMRERGEESEDEQGAGLGLPALMLPRDRTKPGYPHEGELQHIEEWLEALLEFQCATFRREMDENIYLINSPSIERHSFTISGLISASALLKGIFRKGSYSSIPYSALFPGDTEIQIEFAVECLSVRLFLAWKDPSIEDLGDVQDLHIGIAAFDKDGSALQPRVFYERIEDTWLYINVVDERFPLFAVDVERPGIKTLQLNLGGTVLIDKVCYKSALNISE